MESLQHLLIKKEALNVQGDPFEKLQLILDRVDDLKLPDDDKDYYIDTYNVVKNPLSFLQIKSTLLKLSTKSHITEV